MKVCRILASTAALAAISLPAAAAARSTSLENLLVLFADGKEPAAYQSIPGVTWQVFSVPDETRQRFDWTGELRLAGFGEALVPRGVGADNRAVKANEGDSRISVHGDSSGVSHIMVVKYRPTADYTAMLQNQLSSDGKATLIANGCETDSHGDGPDAKSAAFYRLDLAGIETPVFAEVSQDSVGTRYSPGETWLVFRKFNPDAETLRDMGCTIHAAS